ncbi:MAG: protein kinase [Polyangiaceae bacterium]|nr:protein kinase [Polyangiaceae bacterium]
MSTQTLADGTIVAERYRIVRCLARGGMGTVYEVVHTSTNRRRALKLMHSHILHNEELRERFSREAKVAAEVESDYIVEVFDAGVDAGTSMPFICMELLRGEELSRRIKRLGTIAAADVATYVQQTALALDRMHEAGIVHRDLKPENLYISEGKDGPPRIKVLDFGIAKVVAEGVNSGPATLSVGTPLYMAPEQFRAHGKLSPVTDVYALGMIAYTSLVGSPYWDDESRVGNIFAFGSVVGQGIVERPSERAKKKGVTLPTGFDEWFALATNLHAEHRFQSASEASRALSEVLGSTAALGSSPFLPSPVVAVAEHAARVSSVEPSASAAAPPVEAGSTEDLPKLFEDEEGQTLVYKPSQSKADLLQKVLAHREARRAADTKAKAAPKPGQAAPASVQPSLGQPNSQSANSVSAEPPAAQPDAAPAARSTIPFQSPQSDAVQALDKTTPLQSPASPVSLASPSLSSIPAEARTQVYTPASPQPDQKSTQPPPVDRRPPQPASVRPPAFNTLTPSGAVLSVPQTPPVESVAPPPPPPPQALVSPPPKPAGGTWKIFIGVTAAATVGILLVVFGTSKPAASNTSAPEVASTHVAAPPAVAPNAAAPADTAASSAPAATNAASDVAPAPSSSAEPTPSGAASASAAPAVSASAQAVPTSPGAAGAPKSTSSGKVKGGPRTQSTQE